MTGGWDARWEIMNSGFKPFPCGVVTHPAIEAALALHDEQGVRGGDVERLDARCHPLVLELTGKPSPRSGLEGKFSIFHCLAAALVDGAVTPATFTDQRVADPDDRGRAGAGARGSGRRAGHRPGPVTAKLASGRSARWSSSMPAARPPIR